MVVVLLVQEAFSQRSPSNLPHHLNHYPPLSKLPGNLMSLSAPSWGPWVLEVACQLPLPSPRLLAMSALPPLGLAPPHLQGSPDKWETYMYVTEYLKSIPSGTGMGGEGGRWELRGPAPPPLKFQVHKHTHAHAVIETQVCAILSLWRPGIKARHIYFKHLPMPLYIVIML